MTNTIVFGVLDALLMTIMIVAALCDRKTRIVKPLWQWIILGLAVTHNVLTFVLVGWQDGLIDLITGIMLFTIYIVMFLKFKTGIGGVDAKVSSCLALYFGVWRMLLLMVVQSLSAIIYKNYMKTAKKKYVNSVPLMVYLSIGTAVTLLVSYIIKIFA